MMDDFSLQQQNLEALESRYFDDTDAPTGLEHLLTIPEPKLGELLRSHLVEGVGRKETVIRDSVDDLLAYVGILELAAMTGAMPWPPPKPFARKLQRALDLPSVRRYYELFYPLLLPTLFRWRLDGEPLVQHGAFESEIPYFQEFQRLSEALTDSDTEAFLWLLDDGSYWDDDAEQYVGLSDFFQVITRPRRLIKHLGRTRDRSPLTRSVRGFGGFLAFAEAFDLLLSRMSDVPLLRSAFWQNHAYWFYQLSGQVGGVIAASVEEFRGYVDDRPSDRGSKEKRDLMLETHAMMDRSELAMRRLTSSVYRGPLEKAYFNQVLEEEVE